MTPNPSLFATLNIMEAKGCVFAMRGEVSLFKGPGFIVGYPDESLAGLMDSWVKRHEDEIDQALIMRRFYRAQRVEDLAHAG